MNIPLTKILVLEDEDDDYYLLRDMFRAQRNCGQTMFYIERAVSCEAALERVKVDDWNFFISDYWLGEGAPTGLDFIQQANRHQVAVPTILLSGREELVLNPRVVELVRRNRVRFLAKDDLNWDCMFAGICDLLSQVIRVLIVDDDEDDQFMLRSYLEDTGYVNFEIESVCSLAQAIDRLAQELFHVVIVDYHLGLNKGTELVPYLEAQRQDPMIILCTGRDDIIMNPHAVSMIGRGKCRFVSKQRLSREVLQQTILGTSDLAIWNESIRSTN